jgi:membrane-anchored protein YejM (alkaline phosphatase superfamily)
LRAEGFDFSVKKIEEEFEVQEKEDNPFFSVSSQDYDMESAAKSYAESEKHWKKNLSKRFNRQILEEEDLNNLALDLDKKGHIVLEDLVRFLNMETGTFFRNRDLITIFRRICGNNRKLTFNDFLKIICD